jgi:Lipocalin-like domain
MLLRKDFMMRTPMSAIALAFLLTLPQSTAAQDLASEIVGVWKTTSVVTKEVASGKTVHPLGERLNGYYMYSKGGHFMFIFVGADRKAPATANPTDAERIELQKTGAYGSGTYKVEGNKITSRFDTSWHQVWTGTERSATLEISGQKLTITTAPFKSSFTGLDVVSTTTVERVE